MHPALFVGTAGWSIPAGARARFPEGGTHLVRYAAIMPAVEIDSSFYRPHLPSTYARWATSTPEDFRFAVKLPKTITHEQRLIDCAAPLDRFLKGVRQLGERLGALVIQLPPSLAHDPATVEAFLRMCRERTAVTLALEPRHRSWFTVEVDARLAKHRVARIAADPAIVPAAAHPGGWLGDAYFRWHGSPRTYYSDYDEARLARFATVVRHASEQARHVWCIFDNTAAGAALSNAMRFRELMDGKAR